MKRILPLLLLAISCSQSPQGFEVKDEAFSWQETRDILNSRQLIINSSDSFEDELAAGMGTIMSVKDAKKTLVQGDKLYQVGFCTSFLISPTIALTNAHCVAKRVRQNKVDCRDWVFFANKDSSINYNCERLLFVSPAFTREDGVSEIPENDTPDVVVLELAEVPAVLPFELADKPFTQGESVRVLSLDPHDTPYAFQMLFHFPMKGCFVNDDAPGGYPYRLLFGCRSIPGNSGSPVLDDDNRVKGIVYGSFESADIPQKSALSLDLSCLKKSNEGVWQWSSACKIRAPLISKYNR